MVATKVRSRDELEARAEEIRFMGTQYAMSGVAPPPELEREYREILEALRREPERRDEQKE